MLHAQLYILFVFEARNLIFLFGVNKVLVFVLVLRPSVLAQRFKVGLYRIRLVRILCRSAPAVMLSPFGCRGRWGSLSATASGSSAAMSTAGPNITAGVASAEDSNQANPI